MSLLVITHIKDGTEPQVIPLDSAKPLFVGRIPDCDIHLQSPAVSRQHAVLLEKNGVCGIKDLGSANGTYINGERISSSHRIKTGDVIQIGEFILKYMPEKDGVAASVMSPLPHQPSAQTLPPSPPPASHPALKETQPESTPESDPAMLVPEREVASDTGGASFAPDADSEPEAEDSDTDSLEDQAEFRPRQSRDSARYYTPDIASVESDSIDMTDPEEMEKAEEEKEKANLALSKAAAEAGLVGEFSPEVDTESEGAAVAEGDQPTSIGPANQIPIGNSFRAAIETRLSLYSFLSDLSKERQEILESNPNLPDPIKSELARQDRELEKKPTAAQARGMIEKREAKRKALEEKIAEAQKNNTPPPPSPSKKMREAEEMAQSQWRFIIQSEEEAVPNITKLAYQLTVEEPLVKALANDKIDLRFLMGGGAFYLALEVLLDEATKDRQRYKALFATVKAEEDLRKKNKGKPVKDDSEDDDEDRDPDASLSSDELAIREQNMGNRIGWINLELLELEKKLIAEFWKIYLDVAATYLPQEDNMDWSIRAFLRHGAIAFKPWWMNEELQKHIQWDCTTEVRTPAVRKAALTDLYYADEYIAAVSKMECTPALDENLELNERNSPNWKADKALRKLIYSGRQRKQLLDIIATLEKRIDVMKEQFDQLEIQIEKVLPGSRNSKQVKRELQQKQQSVKIEMSKLTKLRDKINNETIAKLDEAITDTEARFESGELPRPSVDFLIRRECDAVHRITRLLANLKERFLPLVVRDYKLNTDAMNDRGSMNSEIVEMERRDPALFLETLVASKKKKDRVDLRISPSIVIVPSPGMLCFSWNPRGGQENGRLAIPTCFIRQRIRERQLIYLFSDFRWDTSKEAAGMDLMTSETIVSAFMTVRWDWRKRSKEGREKGLIYNEQNDRTNWRRVYEAYITTALDAGKKLYNRNYDFYEKIIGKYFDMPEGVELLRK
ncbi:MAG: FHA domain-containing protein [Planctomycetota bacterium]|jgi:pSer/pThr/pTyr-binding forkhead associated (FHA) protein|nr:FHA domain-containing protein [Planctomycetota bacterium]